MKTQDLLPLIAELLYLGIKVANFPSIHKQKKKPNEKLTKTEGTNCEIGLRI